MKNTNTNKIKIDSVFREKLEQLCGKHINTNTNITSKSLQSKNISKHPPPPPPPPPPISPSFASLSRDITSSKPQSPILNQSCVINESINTIQTNNIECINCYRSRLSYYETRQRLNHKLDLFSETIIDNCKDTYLEKNLNSINSKINCNTDMNKNNKYNLMNENMLYCITGIFIGIFTVFTSKMII